MFNTDKKSHAVKGSGEMYLVGLQAGGQGLLPDWPVYPALHNKLASQGNKLARQPSKVAVK